MIITIDGPAGTGKSTVARNLADEMGFIFFDTGAMYRTITYGVIQYKIDINNKTALQTFLDHYPVSIVRHFNDTKFFLGTEDVSMHIRTKEVTDRVSEVSSLAPVREKLVATQRTLSDGLNCVFEGRDMGTVVFPHADVKIFLTASLDVRAKRRYHELLGKNPMNFSLTLDDVLNDIERRDRLDSTRELAPLKAAPDAILIDTSNLTPVEVIDQIINITKETQDKPLQDA
jgi:cytidylate kinase